MEDSLDGYRRAFAYTKIRALKKSDFPIAALDIDSLVLNVFSGDASLAVTIINEVATHDFNYVINGKGEIDLRPPDTTTSQESNTQVVYNAPKIYPRQPHQNVERKGTKHKTTSKADEFGDHLD